MAASLPLSPLFQGQITSLSHGAIRGWALPRHQPHKKMPENMWLHVLIDGQEIERIACHLPCPEEAARYNLLNPNIGFEWEVPREFYDGRKKEISLRFPDGVILPFPADFFKDVPPHEPFLEKWIFEGEEAVETKAYLDGLEDGRLRGWVSQRKGLYGNWRGQCIIDISVDGRPLARLRADRQRPDVAYSLSQDNFSKLEPDPGCGFDFPLPAALRDGAYHEFNILVLPEKIPLAGSPLRTKYVDNSAETRLASLNNMLDTLQNQLTILRREAISLMPHSHKFSIDEYDRWHRQYEKGLSARAMQARLKNPLAQTPLLSLLCPVFHPEPQYFLEAIESVQNQTYPHWELILIFDGKQSDAITKLVTDLQKNDSRLKLHILEQQQGIAGATNAGLKKAVGEYVLFLDHDDLLDPNALDLMQRAAQETGASVVYSDEDKINPSGILHSPHFKPDFNYRYLLGCNYICHLAMYRRDLLDKIGGLEKAYDGAQDHDLVLKAYEHAPGKFHHVPEILYHWRQSPNSTALSSENKTYAKHTGAKAVLHHLERMGHKVSVAPISNITLYQTSWTLPKNPPLVTFIIPFRDQAKMTENCVKQLLKTQSYKNFAIILVDNWSVEPETEAFLKRISKDKKVSVLRVEEEFNFSRLNNLAAQKAKGEYLFFLNNDVEIQQKDFLANMMGEMLNLPKPGAIGARLLYPSKRIQHAGVAVSPKAIAVHLHRSRDEKDFGYMGRALLSQELSAVTGAALLTPKELFVRLGAFDEKCFPVAYNDVDFCLRLRKEGYHVYYCADAVAIHHESFSRGSDEIMQNERRLFQEAQALVNLWGETDFFKQDPFYSKHFILEGETFYQLNKPDES